MRSLLARFCIGTALLLAFAGTSAAQPGAPTIILVDATKAVWTPSLDNDSTFGTPPVANVTKYTAQLFLRANVVNGVPGGAPALIIDFGKPAVVAGEQSSAALKPLVLPGVEYVMFLIAEGPGGASMRSNASPPFGFPAVPRAPSGVHFIP